MLNARCSVKESIQRLMESEQSAVFLVGRLPEQRPKIQKMEQRPKLEEQMPKKCFVPLFGPWAFRFFWAFVPPVWAFVPLFGP